jgi:iron complex outermembrane receptor protein
LEAPTGWYLDNGTWATTLIQNYRTGYEVGHDLNDNRVFLASESIFDANVSYKGFKNLVLAVGVKICLTNNQVS